MKQIESKYNVAVGVTIPGAAAITAIIEIVTGEIRHALAELAKT